MKNADVDWIVSGMTVNHRCACRVGRSGSALMPRARGSEQSRSRSEAEPDVGSDRILKRIPGERTSEAEAYVDSAGFMRGINPPPPSISSFPQLVEPLLY